MNYGDQYKSFFESKDLLRVVDAMATRYSKLPSEILEEMSMYDFNLNVAIMIGAINIQNSNSNDKESEGVETLKEKGFSVEVQRMSKEELELKNAQELDKFEKEVAELNKLRGV